MPLLRRTLTAVETEVAYLLLGATLELNSYERILVRGRIKECESAVASLRRRQEGSVFDEKRPEKYTLTSLPDLVAVRVLAFPRRRLEEAERILRTRIQGWTADPIPGGTGEPIALKYHGHWRAGDRIRAEIQIVPLLIGLFWEIEHDAIYKPDETLRAAVRADAMKASTAGVLEALRQFEEQFGFQVDNRDDILSDENWPE